MNQNASFFFSGQREGVLMVLQALHNLENEKEFSKEYVTNKLKQLCLDDFIEPIIAEFFTQESN